VSLMHQPVEAADGTQGWVIDQRGAPNGQRDYCVATPGPYSDANWFYDSELTVRPAPPPRAVGDRVRCYGQTAEILSYDAAADCYDLAAGIVVPARFQRVGCNSDWGYVACVHRYPAVPAAVLAVWDGEA